MLIDKKSVLERIKPSDDERRERLKAFEIVKKKLAPIKKDVVLTGSVAKGTDLKEDTDIDVFVLFEKNEELSLDRFKKIFPLHVIAYAEHPYIQVKVGGYSVDIVPAYRIAEGEKIISSVDRSQLHTKYVMRKLKEKEKDDVRMLKHFLKKLGIYGAEAKVMGFSGYVCELLIIHYGSFENAIQGMKKWGEKIVIDIEKYKTEDFFNEPLVIIDPVDPHRNTTAIVSRESIAKAVLASQFLKVFEFDEKKKSLKAKRKIIGEIMTLSFPAPDLVEDTLLPQLRKLQHLIKAHLEREDFKVIGTYSCVSLKGKKKECIILVELESLTIPKMKKIIGPAYFHGNGVKRFMKKHACWIENDRLVSVKERKITSAKDGINEVLKSSGVPKDLKSKMKNAKIGRDIPEEYFFGINWVLL